MPEDVYEVLALGMRYWFVLLGVLIVWRAFGWLRKDRREKHRRLRQLPDAGMIGELVVLVGSDELPEGTVIPVPREGVLGFLRTCDVVVPVPGVQDHHLDFSFHNGQGLLIQPWRGCTCQVDADEMDHRSKPRQHPMHHGSRLFVGDAVLRLRVFAGLDVQRHVAYMEDEDPAPDIPETQTDPEQQPYAMQDKWLGPDPRRVQQIGYPPERWNGQPTGGRPYPPNEPWRAPSDEYASVQTNWQAPTDAPWPQPYQTNAPWTEPADERASMQRGWELQYDAAWRQPELPLNTAAQAKPFSWETQREPVDSWMQEASQSAEDEQEMSFDEDVNGDFDYAAPRVRRRRRSRDET